MIIVLGQIKVQPTKLSQALEVSQAHVLRSREEPGCLAHGVHVSHDEPDTLVFVERWRDMGALMAHFQVPESRQFVKAVSALAEAAPVMEIFDASPVPLPGRSAG